MSSESLKTSLKDGILLIKLDRPHKKNAMSTEIMHEITNVFREASKNDAVDFVVLTGNGDYYSSGMDLDTNSASGLDPIKIGREFVTGFIDFPKLLIAIVNGPAVGIAVTTLALCDLVFCSTESTFWVPFTSHGLTAEGCSSYTFPRIMGYARANEILQFSKKFTAAEAKEWGFVSDTFKPEELPTVLSKIQEMRNSLSKESIKINKKLMRQWNMKLLHEVNVMEWEELENRLISPEFLETIKKFSERKQRPTKL